MVEKVFALLILAVCLVMVNRIGWNRKMSPLKNIFFGCAVYVVVGLCYCIPMWLLFIR